MGTIRKEGSRYRVEVRHKSFYRSGRFDTRTEAKQQEAQWESEYLIKRSLNFEPHTLGEAVVRYTREVSPHKKGERWEITRAKAFLRDETGLCAKYMHTIELADIEAWVARRKSTPNQTTGKSLAMSTINRELNWLSAIFTTAVKDWAWSNKNVIHDVRRPKDPPSRQRRISDREIDTILAELNRDTKRSAPKKKALARMFLLAIETGMRLGELCAITRENVHLSARYVRLDDSKNGQGRDVPLSKSAVLYASEQLEFGLNPIFGLSSDVASALFAKAIKATEIVDLVFHDTRHEAITRLARKVDVLDLARMIGHRDINSLRVYYNATASEIADRLD